MDEDTVLLGDSLFGGCGGRVREISGDLDFDEELLGHALDFDSTEARDSEEDLVFDAFDLTELLRESDPD